MATEFPRHRSNPHSFESQTARPMTQVVRMRPPSGQEASIRQRQSLNADKIAGLRRVMSNAVTQIPLDGLMDAKQLNPGLPPQLFKSSSKKAMIGSQFFLPMPQECGNCARTDRTMHQLQKKYAAIKHKYGELKSARNAESDEEAESHDHAPETRPLENMEMVEKLEKYEAANQTLRAELEDMRKRYGACNP